MQNGKHAIEKIRFQTRLPLPYAWAVLLFILGFIMRYTLFPLNAGLAFVTFYPVIILSFYLVGFKAGLLTLILSATASYYVFFDPHFSFKHDAIANVGVIFFICTSLLIGLIIRQLRLSEQRFNVLLEDQTDLISRFDNNGNLLYANAAYLQFFGLIKDDVINRQWQPLVFAEDLQMVTEKVGRISFETPVISIENRVYDQSGSIRWFQFVNHGIFNAEKKLIEIQSVGRDVTDIKLQQQTYDFMAHHDALTGLPNRLLFYDRLNQAIATAKRNGTVVTVCFLDLDGFKPINDQYGHNAGDEVLIEVGRRMQAFVRTTDTVGRMGGDEFMLIINDGVIDKDSAEILNRVINSIGKPITLSTGVLVQVTASVGVCQYPKDTDNPTMLMRMADEKMYAAKAAGRNKIIYC